MDAVQSIVTATPMVESATTLLPATNVLLENIIIPDHGVGTCTVGNFTSDTLDGDIRVKSNVSVPASTKPDNHVVASIANTPNISERDKTSAQNHFCRNKEKMISNVIKQSEILKVSRRLRTRLEYAILKIRRGWSNCTLQEVESLLQSGCLSLSPLSQSRSSVKSSATTSVSTRQSERKRTRKMYPDYETERDVRVRAQAPEVVAVPNLEAATEESRLKRYRPSRPSFSQFKDSELFLPAKSLMDIATSTSSSSPSPLPNQQHIHPQPSSSPQQHLQRSNLANSEFGSAEPLYRESTPSVSDWSTYSTPVSPTTEQSAKMAIQGTFEDRESQHDDEIEGPSHAQAARAILLLASSPTRSPPRSLSNSLVSVAQQKQSIGPTTDAAAATALFAPVNSSMTTYSPITSSPLVQFQVKASTPSPSPSPTASPSGSSEINDNNPFLVKRDATKSSTKALGSRQKEPASVSSPLMPAISPLEPTPSDILPTQETTITPLIVDSIASASTLIPPRTPPPQHLRNPIQEHRLTPLGIRTPPPSGGKEPIKGHYSPHNYSPKSIVEESIAARRLSSSLRGASGVDLVAMYLKSEKSELDPNSPSTNRN
ncbi:hypothetical protein BGZ49_001158 [Haplosporangium sp. Z 27]|nr:hypothetical protein BGZ49_001158 [Haplosporangium sp. Z 27]